MPFSAGLAAASFGLASAASFGAADFCRGFAAKRAHVFGVLTAARLCGLVMMVLRRKLGWLSAGKPESDVALMPAPIEALFRVLVQGEAMIAGLGIPLPFGGSVLATAVKP